GQDIVWDLDNTAGNLDRIVFKAGVAAADVLARRRGEHLVLSINGTADTLTVVNYFVGDGAGGWAIEEIRFTDAPTTVWKVANVKAMALVGMDGNDVLQGYASADVLDG